MEIKNPAETPSKVIIIPRPPQGKEAEETASPVAKEAEAPCEESKKPLKKQNQEVEEEKADNKKK